MDRLESMSTFVAVVDAGSLSAAARRMRMPLSTVSRKVAELEEHLKTRLLNRSTRRLTLTDAGRDYHAACKLVLEEIGEAERAAAGEYRAPRGDLVIAAPLVLGRTHVLPVVTEFLRSYPEIDVRLVLSDRLANLLEERIDLAIRIGELQDSGLVASRIGTVQRVVCGSPGYLARRGTPKRPEDLRGHDCVTFEGLSGPSAWIFKSGKVELTVAVRSRLAVNTAEAAVDAAIAGVGLTRVVSYQMLSAERAGALVRVLRAFEKPAAPVHLVHTGQRLPPLKLRAFLDHAMPQLRARLAPEASD
jgi:DNA-binding transcriptional LysR family regulator